MNSILKIETMHIKLLIIFFLVVYSNPFIAQTNIHPTNLFLDSASTGGICKKSCKELHIYGPNKEVTDFTIIQMDLFIHSTSKFYSVYSSKVSDEMTKALEKLTPGTQVTFKAIAVNSKKKTIAVVGVFFVE